MNEKNAFTVRVKQYAKMTLFEAFNCTNVTRYGKQFLGGFRINNAVEYTVGRQTYSQLAAKYKCSIRTIQRRLDKYSPSKIQAPSRAVIVLMDATY